MDNEEEMAGEAQDAKLSSMLAALAALNDSADEVDEEATYSFSSIADAKQALHGAAKAKKLAGISEHIRRVTSAVSNAEAIAGLPAEWHNLTSQLMNLDECERALEVALAARTRFPADATLLGDAILCAGRLTKWELGDALVEEAKLPEHRVDENWALSVYVADYLKARMVSQDAAGQARALDEALAFLDGAIERLAPNDRIFNAKAEVLLQAGRTREAKQLLEDVIFRKETVGDGAPNPRRFPVPQCCLTYLNDVLEDSCDYETVIRVAEVGIRFTTTEAESARLSYFVYRKALAMDGQLNSAQRGSSRNFGNQDFVRETLRTYALAYALYSGTESRRERCQERFTLLSVMGGVDDLSVDMFEK